MITEFNCNFTGQQLIVYNENQVQIARFTGEDFIQFVPFLAIIETACIKTEKQIEEETLAKITDLEVQKAVIDEQISDLQTSIKVVPSKE